MINQDTTSQIKPIETKYKGYRFESRLEARWAIFFDCLGLNWEYECEGYDLGDKGFYLPDFFIVSPQGYNFYYEIKPRGYIPDGKLTALIDGLNSKLYNKKPNDVITYDDIDGVNGMRICGITLMGDPIDIITRSHPTVCPRCGVIRPDGFECGGYKSDDEIMCGCAICDFTEGNGHYTVDKDKCLFNHTYHKGWICVSDIDHTIYSRQILTSALSARQARFEHGETP